MITPARPHADAHLQHTQAAQVVWEQWQSGQAIASLPDSCRPLTALQGYLAQAQLPGVSGRDVVGWKIAATSSNGQAHINVSSPLAGRLLSGQVVASAALSRYRFGN